MSKNVPADASVQPPVAAERAAGSSTAGSSSAPASSAAANTTGGAPVSSAPISTAALPDDPTVLKQMIAELLRELRRERRDRHDVEQRLDALLQRLYGRRPDTNHPDQGSLFADDDDASPPSAPPLPPAPPEDPPAKRRGHCKPHGRGRPPRHLRHEVRRHDLTAAERLCPECHEERAAIGVATSTQYDYKPAEVFVVEHQQVKYACKGCEGHVTLAAKPAPPLDKSLPGPGLLAQITVDKYQDHLPLHRSEQRFARLGAPLTRSTMCDWMAATAVLLTPLWQCLKAWVLASKVLHTDDTTVPVRDENRTSHRYGRLWDYIGDADHPGVVFDYTMTHARDGPADFLANYQGFLQADAYGAYDGIYTGSNGKIVEVGCWAHARNKFAAAQSSDPERVVAVKAWVRKLYDVEDEAKECSAAERLRLRQEKSVPLLTSLRHWLRAQQPDLLPKSPIAAAITYVFNQWEALNRYTTDGDLHIDNNVSERMLKLIGIGRDNWLFLGSDKGGATAAVLYSFTATCKHLRLDTFAYLRDVLERLPTHPADNLEALLPHRWQAARQAAASSPPGPTPS
jgi:transposase